MIAALVLHLQVSVCSRSPAAVLSQRVGTNTNSRLRIQEGRNTNRFIARVHYLQPPARLCSKVQPLRRARTSLKHLGQPGRAQPSAEPVQNAIGHGKAAELRPSLRGTGGIPISCSTRSEHLTGTDHWQGAVRDKGRRTPDPAFENTRDDEVRQKPD